MSTLYKDKNITKMYYGSKPVYSFSVEDGGGTGGDTTTYSYKTPTADVEGLKALGWDDKSIGYFRDNNLCYDWQKDNYIVTDGNKELYGVVTKDNISTYKSDPNFVYCPMIDTSNVASMNYMFYGCSLLQSIPLLNTSNVTNMSNMFIYCSTLQSIPPIDTSKVTDMGNMFAFCQSLQSIPLLDTANVIDMSGIFDSCQSLQSIPLLNTSKVTNMSNMFYTCRTLQSIPQIDTSNVTNMRAIFYSCSTLQSIPMLDTSKVIDMNYMFYGCSLLQSIPQFDTSNVTDMGNIFYSCQSLQSIPPIDTSKVTNMTNMFNDCRKIQSIPLLDCGIVTNMSNFFGWSNINTLTDLGGFKDLKISVTSSFLEKAPNLTVESLMNVINNVYDLTANGLSGQSLKFGSTNLNKLTAEQVAIATAKGWTLTA